MRFIGDVHGKMQEYAQLLEGCDASVQVGDFGMGFASIPPLDRHHRFIRGNHDNPALCRAHPNWIPDGMLRDGVFYLGGAWSIDHEGRIPGISHWYDEELSWSELALAVEGYVEARPRVVISHDGPEEITEALFMNGSHRFHTRTSQALQAMLDVHRPKLWIFGHWHIRVDQIIEGTRFVCLEELGVIDIDLNSIP